MFVPRRVNLPPLVLVVAGITPLLPGLTLYRGFAALALDAVSDGAVTILLALTFSLALAAGVSFGEQIGGPLQNGLRRLSGRRARSHGLASTDGVGEDAAEQAAQGRTRRPRVF